MAAQARSFESWNVYYYYFGDGDRCIVKFNVAACDPQNQRPSWGRRVIAFSPVEQVGPDGTPRGPAFERLKEIEDRFIDLLTHWRIPAWLVGTQTYRGMRELVFQVDAPYLQSFDLAYGQLAQEHQGTKLTAYEGWSFFNEKIAPGEDAWAHIANRDLLQAARDAGADLEGDNILDHTFVGDPARLARVKDALAANGYAVKTESAGSLTMSKDPLLALDQDNIDRITAELRQLAKRCGVSYDGWGMEIRSAGS
jgi:regulator of RNase E activity RraB